jgi:hypothetical protein
MRMVGRGCLGLLVCVSAYVPAFALTETGTLGKLHYSLYAPDWTWQGRDLNILAVFENDGSETAEVTVRLILPPGKEDHFEYDGPASISATVPPGGTVRKAFTNVNALKGFPRQEYAFAFEMECGERSARAAYPMRTIRGQVFSGGRMVALFVPAGIALVWCIVVALVMRRFAKAGAWKTPSPPVSDDGGDKCGQ